MERSSIPLYWRLKRARYNLVGSICTNCTKLFYPQRPICPDCRRSGKTEDFQFAGNGKIVSHTVIRVAPSGFEKYSPYAVAIIKLDEGVDITGQICSDPEKVETGKRVKPVFRKIYENNPGGVIHYGIKFELVE